MTDPEDILVTALRLGLRDILSRPETSAQIIADLEREIAAWAAKNPRFGEDAVLVVLRAVIEEQRIKPNS